jgi:hypothetical protein
MQEHLETYGACNEDGIFAMGCIVVATTKDTDSVFAFCGETLEGFDESSFIFKL